MSDNMPTAPEIFGGDDGHQSACGEKTESQPTAIVRLATEAGAELWHTPGGDGYVSVTVDQHREHHPLFSRGARDYLTRLYYRETGKAPNATAMQAAVATLSGIARFDGAEHEVHVRVGAANGHIYLDLCDPRWRVVEVTAYGWRVVGDPPVRFRRARGMLPLPVPVIGGSIDELLPFVNVASKKDFVLMVAWELAAFRPWGPYPILIFVAVVAVSGRLGLIFCAQRHTDEGLRIVPRDRGTGKVKRPNAMTTLERSDAC